MNILSEELIRKNCPHCDVASHAFEYLLEKTENFNVVCDSHPICEGHVLIIPKKHLSCIGEYSNELMKDFLELYNKYRDIIKNIYGQVANLSMGKLGKQSFIRIFIWFLLQAAPRK